ncbi:sulfatase-like hydrolase/transferase [bacterium]|nr:sulfatase-like hydrolase/transferase [bacterium]
MKNTSWIFVLVLFLLSSCLEKIVPPEVKTPTNIILISLDACRADFLSCYGFNKNTSPFLDELAGNGIRFANAFVNTHGTPTSHTTILTSLYQETHGVDLHNFGRSKAERRVIPNTAVQVQEILQQNGYLTLGVTGGGNMSGKLGFSRGFVEYYDRNMSIEKQSTKLINLLDKYSDGSQPTFLFFHTYEIHSPYKAPAKYRDKFTVHKSSFDPTSKNLIAVANAANAHLSMDDLEYIREQYEAEIAYSDDVLLQLFTDLGKRKFLDNVLVVITSDHGEEFAEHGGLLHRVTLFEELLHVPLLLWGNSVNNGVVDERLVSSIDIAPTILAVAGIDTPAEMEGRNLLTDEKQLSAKGEEIVFAQYAKAKYSARTHRWKLIQNKRDPFVELYDLLVDPAETENVADENRMIADRLQREIMRWKTGLKQLLKSNDIVSLNEKEIVQLEALGYVN